MIEYYSYWIIFNGSYEEYEPILQYGSLEKMRENNVGTMHLFDKNMESILPAVEYVMHMPRLELDLYDLDERTIDTAYDEAHNIIPIPDSIFIELCGAARRINPTLIIYADDCNQMVEKASSSMNPILGSYRVSQLSEKLLKEHWCELSDKSEQEGYEKKSDVNNQYDVV